MDFLKSLQNAHVYSFIRSSVKNLTRAYKFKIKKSNKEILNLWQILMDMKTLFTNDYTAFMTYQKISKTHLSTRNPTHCGMNCKNSTEAGLT